MRRTLFLFGAAGLACLALLSACGLQTGPPARSGETVTPRLNEAIQWSAGKPGQMGVRLIAHGKDSPAGRTLGFSGIPDDVNPVAAVTFFQGEQSLPPVTVTLDHRC